MTYKEFLQTKIEVAPESGFEIDKSRINKALKPHQKDAVAWAIRGGRRALFESFGLGKTIQEIEFCYQVIKEKGGKALIVLPLGVKQEFIHDAVEILKYDAPQYVRNMEEVETATTDILITNYERVRDGDIRPDYFMATSLDEASVLRSFGSKTYQEFLTKFKMFAKLTGWDYRKMAVYILCNFDTTFEQDLERVYTLRDMGYNPYVMLYNKDNIPQGHRLRHLQRWVNNRIIFRTCKKFEDYLN